ncbi:MAG: ferrous iron transport protein A [Vicinamibacteria bacterium]|nr:ferrous iron transport protein A [Vicinamibacteria bacterium]
MLSLAESAVSTPPVRIVATPLAAVADGSSAIVRRLVLPRATARRLFEMGLLPGTRVRVVRRAPLGDPIELRLRNYSLSIRREEAALIEVEPAV